MNKYIFALIVILGSFNLPAPAQTIISELIREIQGMTPAAYYELSQEAGQFYRQRNFAKAAEAYDKLTKAYPWNGANWQRLGSSLYQLGKYKEAIQPYIKAQELGVPEISQIYVLRIAMSYARAGDADNALVWLEKTIRDFRLENRSSLLEDKAFESLRNNTRFLELIGSSSPKRPLKRDEGWRFDVDYLLSEIKRVNPIYNKQPLPLELVNSADRLKRKIPKLSDAQILLEMQHLLVLLRQSHNNILPSAKDKFGNLTHLPVSFYAFPEGLYIVDAEKGYEDLIGARVLRFDETVAERALEAIEYVISRENDMEVLWKGPDRLRIPQWLHALKLTANPDRVKLTVLDRHGKTRSVSPEPVSLASRQKLKAPRLTDLSAPPLYLSRADDEFWFEYLAKDKTLYLQFNQVVDKENESLAQFGLRVRDFLGKNEVRNLVVDMRRNHGGTTALYPELLRTLIDFDANKDNRLFVLIGRWTFSAASNFISEVDRLSNAVFVGEPSGGKPLLAGGDESSFKLPYSGVGGFLSSTSWQLTVPRDTRLWITPDIPVQLTAKDYFVNRDTVMETLLTMLVKDTKQ